MLSKTKQFAPSLPRTAPRQRAMRLTLTGVALRRHYAGYFHQLYPTVNCTLALIPGFLSPSDALEI
jgi:hypothetical protein